jgi:polyisoprenyl-teichoic acid--peptidoglycan teichoic acid transferase
MSRRELHEPGMAPLPAHVRKAIREALPSSTPAPAQPGRRRKLLIGLIVVVAVAIAGIGGSYGYARLRFGQIASIRLPSLGKAPAPGKPFTMLVVGSDTRQGLSPSDNFGKVAGQRADVIILVRVVPASHTARLLSIPRDLYVPIAGTSGSAKINSAFDKGPDQLIQTIEHAFGLDINHYLLVNFDGFRQVVDSLGGIQLDFPVPVRDWKDGHNQSGLNIATPGCRRLNGDQALALARSRYFQYRDAGGRWRYDPGFDLGRIRRQQTFLRVLAATALHKGLANPLRANSFIGSLVHSLTKDDGFSIGEATRLAGDFRAFDPSQLASQTIPTDVAVHQGSTVLRAGDPGFQQAFQDPAHWEQVLLPKPGETGPAVASFLGQQPPATSAAQGSGGATSSVKPTNLKVSVRNGTRRQGLASGTVSSLKAHGFQASNGGNAATTSRTTIYTAPGQEATALALDRVVSVGGPVRRLTDSSLAPGSLVLVLGSDFRSIRAATGSSSGSGGAPTTSAQTPATAGSTAGAAAQLPPWDPRPC